MAANPDFNKGQGASLICMASGQANAEISGGGRPLASPSGETVQGPAVSCTSNGEDVFPTLCATDGDKQFIDNQSVNGGRLILARREHL